MTTAKRIAKNSLFLFLGNVTGAILQLILLVTLTRYLGDFEFGKYSFAVSFTALFVIISDLGLSVLSIREISREKENAGEYLTTISVTKLILSIIAISLIVLTVNLMNYPPDKILAVYLIGGITIISSFTSFFRSIFRAFEKMEYEAVTSILEKILVFSAAFPVLLLEYGLTSVISAMLVAQVIIFMFTMFILIKKFTKPALKFNPVLSKRLIRAALPFGLASVFSVIYFQTDTVMLSMMKGDAVVGWYSAAYRLVIGTIFIPTAFVGALYPVLSRVFTESKENFLYVYQKAFKILAIIAIPLGVGTTLLAEKIILFLYGPKFSQSIPALQILIWVVTLMFLYMIVGYVLASMNKQSIDTRTTAVSAILNVILNLLLIPKYSFIGAGIASIISQAFLLTFELSYLQRNGYKIDVIKLLSKPLAASGIMGIYIYFFNQIIPLLIIIPTAIVVYLTSLYLLKSLDEDDLRILKNIAKTKSSMRIWQSMRRG